MIMASNFNTLVQFELTDYIDKEYLPMIEDIIRMVMLQFTVNLMYFIKNPDTTSLFSLEFIELLVYIVLGVSVYWLLFKKLVRFI